MKQIEVAGLHVSLLPSAFTAENAARQLATQFNFQGEDDAYYVMNADQLMHQFEEWNLQLPRVHPFYAVKCNNDPVLLRMLASLGCNFDCASKSEIDSVLSLKDVTPDRIIYANPCKTRSYIRHASANGVKLMTFDNEEELHKIANIFPAAELVLRIAVTDPTAICQLNVKFGCVPTYAPALLAAAAEMKLKVVGISFHVGSGARDAGVFGEGITIAKQLFEVGKDLGHDMRVLDIGGGYPGVPSQEITFEQIANVVNDALDVHFPEGESDVRIIAEPGRFFAAAAFTLVCNIIAKTKVAEGGSNDQTKRDGVMYYLNDGVYGSFNCILYDHFHPMGVSLFENQKSEMVASSVWGPTCDGLDVISPQCNIPEMQEGEWMVFYNMGAYTLAAGSEFNGFPKPKVNYFGQKIIWEDMLNSAGECHSPEINGEIDDQGDGGFSSSFSVSSSCEETDQE